MGIKFLVIDDSTTIQKVIKIAFSKFDVEITAVSTHIEALADIMKSSPQMIIADASLAGEKSIALLQRVREAEPNVPFVLLKGSYEGIDEELYAKSGFEDFIKKPFEASELIKQVKERLGGELPLRKAKEEPTEQDYSLAIPTGDIRDSQTLSPKPSQAPGSESFSGDGEDTGPLNRFSLQDLEPVQPTDKGRTKSDVVQMDLGFLDRVSPNVSPPTKMAVRRETPVPTKSHQDQEGSASFSHAPAMELNRHTQSVREELLGERVLRRPEHFASESSTTDRQDINDWQQHMPASRSSQQGRHGSAAMGTLAVDLQQFESPQESYPIPPPFRPKAAPEPMEYSVEKPSISDVSLEQMVKKSVETYCQTHFDHLAREVIVREIQRLTDEKASIVGLRPR